MCRIPSFKDQEKGRVIKPGLLNNGFWIEAMCLRSRAVALILRRPHLWMMAGSWQRPKRHPGSLLRLQQASELV